jgi:hypothetical protein
VAQARPRVGRGIGRASYICNTSEILVLTLASKSILRNSCNYPSKCERDNKKLDKSWAW